ncbi:MAG TPA: GTP 3',8-cyclase MoaA [Candidatus Micrarchaeia archaeon]|nr:GTP 3',8-cyclase MoaA [Candidatus Micrarchaeia archaeon]
MSSASAPTDRLGRRLRDLRVSVTDRCNFRCGYCMPRSVYGPGFRFAPRAQILTFEEIARLVAVATRIGVRKVRLTGGEPLVRRDLERLVDQLAALPLVEDLALTTNGSLLAGKAAGLRAAGLRRVTVSLDSLDPTTFARMNDVGVPVATVLEGIDAARSAGFCPIKLNMVVRRGLNDDGLLDLVDFARRQGHVLRCIEYMDVGHTNGWRMDEVVPAAEIIGRIDAVHRLEPLPPRVPGEVARRYRYLDGGGEVGVIASVTEPFCGACTRARLSAEGRLYTCLFATGGDDLRAPLRQGASDAELLQRMAGTWQARADRYSELRAGGTPADPRRVEMSTVGG